MRRRRERERWGATRGETGEKSPRKFNSRALGERPRSDLDRPGRGQGDRQSPSRQGLWPWGCGGHSPCGGDGGGGAPDGPGHPAAAQRPAPALPRPAWPPGPRPGAAPSVRPRHTGPVRNPTHRTPRGRGERRWESASASRPWGTREAGALPLGRARDGGEGRAEVGAPRAPSTVRLRRAETAAPR